MDRPPPESGLSSGSGRPREPEQRRTRGSQRRTIAAVLGCFLLGLCGRALAAEPAVAAPPPAPVAASPPSVAPAVAPPTAAAPPTTAAPSAGGSAASGSGSAGASTVQGAALAGPATGSLGVLLWTAAPGEPIAPALAQALTKQGTIAPSGALRSAGVVVATARRAVLELKCSEAIAMLDKAADAVLAEVSLPEARPLLSEAYGLMLVCADRLNDRERAEKASAALTAMQSTVPSDVALVLARYAVATQPPFGPPRAPVRVETDPPGAVVARNLIPVGVTPLVVAGGNPAVDVLDIELPGMRKLRRPLGSGTELVLSLRPEDRPGVLCDRAAQLPLGSDEQAAVLRQLAESPQAQTTLPSRRLIVIGPKERAGSPVAEEPLVARIYDLDRRQWTSGRSEVAIGPPATQAGRVFALLSVAGPAAAPAGQPKAVAAAASAAKPPEKEKPASGFKLAFGKTKWYTWVIAGGVVALLAGILIADKVSSDSVTVTATH